MGGTVLREWWQELADLVLPADCAGCGAPRAGLCPECADLLGAGRVRRVRPEPGQPAAAAPRDPVRVAAALPPVYAAGGYGDELRAVLLAHKERGALRLTRPLASALAGAVRAAARPSQAWGAGTLLLVPVPSARRAVGARGHDPVLRMARGAAGELRGTGLPARVVPALRRRRRVADQAGLTASARAANLDGALTVPGAAGRLLAEGPIVLVDDLMTTGASLAEAARAVAAGGGRVVGAAVVAAVAGSGLSEGLRPAAATASRPRAGTDLRGGTFSW